MKPDILIYLSDQHAPQYIGGGEMPVDTPALDALRTDGTDCAAAYTPCPLCVPARMSMLSGLLPSKTGVYTNNDTLSQTIPTFVHALAAEGYETVLAGRMHFIGPDLRHGFQKRIAPDFTNSGWVRPSGMKQDFGVHTHTMGYKWCTHVVGGGESPVMDYDKMVVRQTLRYLEKPHEKPQFILVGTYGPHFPYVAPSDLFFKYLESAQLPGTWRGDDPWMNRLQKALQEKDNRKEVVLACQAAYKGAVEHTDMLIGQVRKAFHTFCIRRGSKELFGYLSDHGDTVGEHGIYGKKSFFEKSVRIPMIFAGDGVAAGQCIEEPVSLLDLGPTLCEWAGVGPMPEADGKSLAPVLQGAPPECGRAVFSEIVDMIPGEGWTYSCMVRQGPYKWITCHRDEAHDQLFDVTKDPKETENLAPEHAELCVQLRTNGMPKVDPQEMEERQALHSARAALLGRAETAAGGDDRERYHDYPAAARQAPEYCVTRLTSEPGKNETSEFLGLPERSRG